MLVQVEEGEAVHLNGGSCAPSIVAAQLASRTPIVRAKKLVAAFRLIVNLCISPWDSKGTDSTLLRIVRLN
jgi:hypothetical protein